MTVKTGGTWTGMIVCRDSTGALSAPSVGPVGTLYVEGVADAASVAVTGSNPYKWTVTLPALTAGQAVDMYITATISSIATAAVVAHDQADTALISEAYAEAVAVHAHVATIDGHIMADYGATEKAAIDLLDDAAGGLADIHTDIGDLHTDVGTALTRIGTPVALDSGSATLAAMLVKMADDSGGSDFDATTDSLAKLDVRIAVSAAQAAAAATGDLALRTYHTWEQTITSTVTKDLSALTKLWLTIKESPDDADTAALLFLEKTAGLTYVAKAAYASTTHGTITVSGSSGDWDITFHVDVAALALLSAYAETWVAELKGLDTNGDTVSVWDGEAAISKGIVKTVS